VEGFGSTRAACLLWACLLALGAGLAAAPKAGKQAQNVLAASGGALTVQVSNREAFSSPAPGLDAAQRRVFAFGNRLFNTGWVVAPASPAAFDGLGPTFNRHSCAACHIRDGRGRPPLADERALFSMLVRLSVPGLGVRGAPKAVAHYGDQLNDRAMPGVPSEGRVQISYREQSGNFADGEHYSLRAPRLNVDALAFGALPRNVMLSARVAPAVFGLGLLEAIPEQEIVAGADPFDANGDGISGKANRVWSLEHQRELLGRFGWKANVATLMDQSALAASADMGITSVLIPNQNCPPAQAQCRAAVSGGQPELSADFLAKLTQYVQMLGVPARRASADPAVPRGERVFTELGCAACHRASFSTGKHALSLLSKQVIYPYTDLLLHDMGPGLADGRPDHLASGQEWRTAPLWGLGLIETVNGHQLLLHDGRARGISEAILWHGGEAQSAADGYRRLPRAERTALLAFLRSL